MPHFGGKKQDLTGLEITRREYEQNVEYQWAVNALNEELDCAGNEIVSCEGYEAAMDMVKVKWKCGTRRNVETCHKYW